MSKIGDSGPFNEYLFHKEHVQDHNEQNVRENPYLPAKRFRFLDDLHPVAPESKYSDAQDQDGVVREGDNQAAGEYVYVPQYAWPDAFPYDEGGLGGGVKLAGEGNPAANENNMAPTLASPGVTQVGEVDQHRGRASMYCKTKPGSASA